MTGNPDGLRILEKYSQIPASSIRYVPDADADIVRTIEHGILFLVAFWSGPSLSAFAKLTGALHDLDATDLELVAVDVDGSAGVYQVLEPQALVPSGVGEAVYCRQGQAVHAAILGSNWDQNQAAVNAREFVKACRGYGPQ